MAQRGLGFWQRLVASIVRPVLVVMSRPDWHGMEHIPATGPVIIVANHVSHADPLMLAHFVYDAGRWPHYLAKAGVFRLPVVGRLLYAVEQIPVSRGTVDAAKAIEDAVDAIHAGKSVLIYPEGTTTRQPQLWPMRGKTGAARLFLATGAPMVPVAMWGPQRLFDPRTRKLRPIPRTPVTVVAGPPLDLRRWAGLSPSPTILHDITDVIMLRLRDMLAEIRGVRPPPLWSPPVQDADPAADGRAAPPGAVTQPEG